MLLFAFEVHEALGGENAVARLPLAQQVALATAAEAPVEQQAGAEPAIEQPARKRVCRSVLDTRVGLIAKSRKICREVSADDAAN